LATSVINHLAKHFSSDEKINNVMLNDFYTDDCLSGADTPEEAAAILKKLHEILKTAKFNFRRFESNSKTTIRNFAKELVDNENDLELNTVLKDKKPLGLRWNLHHHYFDCRSPRNMELPNTKQKILSKLSSLFDPLGFVAPLLVHPRPIFQNLCKPTKSNWDDKLESSTIKNGIKHAHNYKKSLTFIF
jgi:Pao retrotransposon peptidase